MLFIKNNGCIFVPHRNFKRPLDEMRNRCLKGFSFLYLWYMELRIILQPPFAMLVGLEAINRLDESDNIIVDGIALHFLLFSLEFRWD